VNRAFAVNLSFIHKARVQLLRNLGSAVAHSIPG
jgi:O-acetylhomoserine/O-acetylserine sulfhydrylase-like pyridoxal-dependent enzyme